jgi:hypothetical protein
VFDALGGAGDRSPSERSTGLGRGLVLRGYHSVRADPMFEPGTATDRHAARGAPASAATKPLAPVKQRARQAG